MPSLATQVALFLCGFVTPTWSTFQTAHDERLLGLNASPGPAVIERFRRNMLTPAEVRDVETLIDRLGHDDFRQRERAHEELPYWPAGAEAILKRHERDDNLERRRRVGQILQKGMGRWSPTQAEAAARLLRHSPSSEAVRVLLDYVPFADEPGVKKEIAAALRGFAKIDGLASPIQEAVQKSPLLAEWLADRPNEETSPSLLALERARAFFTLVAQSEAAKIAETTGLPFSVGNGLVLTTPDQRDDFFRQASANFKTHNSNAAVTFLHVARGDDYLRLADDQEREHFASVPPDELRAVHVRVRRDWQHEELGVVLVRVNGQGALVVGLGQTGLRNVRGK